MYSEILTNNNFVCTCVYILPNHIWSGEGLFLFSSKINCLNFKSLEVDFCLVILYSLKH